MLMPLVLGGTMSDILSNTVFNMHRRVMHRDEQLSFLWPSAQQPVFLELV
jgi:hypothetical protein